MSLLILTVVFCLCGVFSQWFVWEYTQEELTGRTSVFCRVFSTIIMWIVVGYFLCVVLIITNPHSPLLLWTKSWQMHAGLVIGSLLADRWFMRKLALKTARDAELKSLLPQAPMAPVSLFDLPKAEPETEPAPEQQKLFS